MSDTCSHDCDHCSSNCESREGGISKTPLHEGSKVRRVIGVVSGKGGVGKSLVTSLLASTLQKQGKRAAILDADVTGPSIPKVFGVHEQASGTEDGILPNRTKSGIQIMSTNLILENETDPVIWRGPVITGVVQQFWSDVLWQDVDCMFVDMPPGTGDVPLTVFQSLPVDGIVIVTSPQELVEMIVGKAVGMADKMHIPVLGLVENMSYAVCPHCGEKIEIFGRSRVKETAERFGIKEYASLPMLPALAEACDAGLIEDQDIDALSGMLEVLLGD